MRIVLAGVNAKFIHSNLAIKYLKAFAESNELDIVCCEYTINKTLQSILSDIYAKKPALLGFSCYIWNIEQIMKLVTDYKNISQKTRILLGGPEVSYNGDKILEAYPEVDFIISGEGERSFSLLLRELNGSQVNLNKGMTFLGIDHEESSEEVSSLQKVPGLIYRTGDGVIHMNPKAAPLKLDELPFVYQSLTEYENKIIYYESSRGCPFSCGYCLSSTDRGVRYRSLELVKKELKYFLECKVKQVKFVDRTFNCSKKHAMEIWRFLSQQDNEVTNFHFEIAAHLLDDEMIDFLQTVRPGLFQFEIGVQSTYEETLSIVNRQTDFEAIKHYTTRLRLSNNIHLHLDLIAGLPKESYLQFKKSFNDVFSLKPEKLQLGFLKVLKGSMIALNAEDLGLHYSEYPPYEVLWTRDMNYEALTCLKWVEEMVEIYYNSGNYSYSIDYLLNFFPDPFSLFEALNEFYAEYYNPAQKYSKLTYYTLLKAFAESVGVQMDFMVELLKLDLLLQEKPKRLNDWMALREDYKSDITAFYGNISNIKTYLPSLLNYTPKQISKMAHLEAFDYDVLHPMKGNTPPKQPCFLLFDYSKRDKMKHHATVYKVQL